MKKEKRNKEEKMFMTVTYSMVAILIMVLLVYFVMDSLNNFNYKGLAFEKQMFGKIPVYHYSYYYDDKDQLYQYNLYLRNDPRKNEVIYEGGAIEFKKGETVFLSYNSSINGCQDNSIAAHEFNDFLTGNLLPVKAGVPDPKEAKMYNITHITCDTKPSNVVIVLQAGNETKITQKDKCYTITVNNCETVYASEKFIVQAILDAKSTSF